MMAEIKIIADNDLERACLEDIKNYLKEYVRLQSEKRNLKDILEIKIEVRTMNKQENRVKHEIKSKVITDKEVFHSKRVGWNCFMKFRESMESINSQLDKIINRKNNSRKSKSSNKTFEVVY